VSLRQESETEKEMEKETNGATKEPLILRLYIAGNAPNSAAAKANLEAICNRSLDSRESEVEIIDILEEPLRALEDGVLVTPTLRKITSPPVSIVGSLNDHDAVKQALGLHEGE